MQTTRLQIHLSGSATDEGTIVEYGAIENNGMKKCAALVVEDDESLQQLLRFILSKHCSSVHVATDGERAIEMLGNGCYDLLLLDLMLPKMNGFAVAEAGQALPKRPRIIVLSAISRYFTDRFPIGTVVLQKPYDVERLDEVLRTMELR